MEEISFSSYLEALGLIGQRFNEIHALLEPDSMHVRGQDSIYADMTTLSSLLTELRRLRKRLNKEMSARASYLNRRPDRDKLAQWNKENTRSGLILSDINTLFASISSALQTCRKWVHQPVYLYVLANPLTGDVRYVGKTRDPDSRLQEHLASPTNAAMAQWFADLSDEGLIPEMEIIEIVGTDNWQETEARQIWRYRQMGFDLLNRDGPG